MTQRLHQLSCQKTLRSFLIDNQTWVLESHPLAQLFRYPFRFFSFLNFVRPSHNMPFLLHLSLLFIFISFTCVSSLSVQIQVAVNANINFDLLSLGPPESRQPHVRPFRHPGLLHTTTDFERIKSQKNVGRAMQQAYNGFMRDWASDLNRKMRGPHAVVHHGIVTDLQISYEAFRDDSEAARQLALVWAIDGNERAGRKSVEILDSWGSTLKQAYGKFFTLLFFTVHHKARPWLIQNARVAPVDLGYLFA